MGKAKKAVDINLPEPVKGIDPECVALCKAMNAFRGVTTRESCCGHAKGFFRIWFKVQEVRDLFPILRACDRRYGGSEWGISGALGDTGNGVAFLLESRTEGDRAYSEAQDIVTRLGYLLENENACSMFEVKLKAGLKII